MDYVQAKLLADTANSLPAKQEFSSVIQMITTLATGGQYLLTYGGLFQFSSTAAQLTQLGFTVATINNNNNTVDWS